MTPQRLYRQLERNSCLENVVHLSHASGLEQSVHQAYEIFVGWSGGLAVSMVFQGLTTDLGEAAICGVTNFELTTKTSDCLIQNTEILNLNPVMAVLNHD